MRHKLRRIILPDGRRVAWIVAASLFIAFALIAVGMQQDAFNETDMRFYTVIFSINSAGFTDLVIALTQLGSTAALLGSAVLLVLIPKTRMGIGIPAALMLAASAAVNTAVKQIFQRDRPSILPLVTETTFSFPSGHAMNSLVFYGMLCILLCLRLKRARDRRVAVVCASLLIASIGLSRVYLGVHFFSDMLAAFALGGALLALAFPAVRAVCNGNR